MDYPPRPVIVIVFALLTGIFNLAWAETSADFSFCDYQSEDSEEESGDDGEPVEEDPEC